MIWFFGILMMFVVLALVIVPLVYRKESYGVLFTDLPQSSRRNLKEEKNSLILALKELDFDYETGKLSKQDYRILRDRYEAKTVDVMKALDVVEAQWTVLQEQIDRELAARASEIEKNS